MLRLGALLMIIGANLVAGSIAVAFYLAVLDCAMAAANGNCGHGAIALFLGFTISPKSIVFWIGVAAGALLFWRGKRMRSREQERQADTLK